MFWQQRIWDSGKLYMYKERGLHQKTSNLKNGAFLGILNLPLDRPAARQRGTFK